MVLRRTLPSRLTGAPPAGGKPATNKPVNPSAEPLLGSPLEAAPATPAAPRGDPNAAALAAAAALVTVAPPIHTPAAVITPATAAPDAATPSPAALSMAEPVAEPQPTAAPAPPVLTTPTMATVAAAPEAEFGPASSTPQRVLEDSFVSAASSTPAPVAVAEPIVATAPEALATPVVSEPSTAPLTAIATPAAPEPGPAATAPAPAALTGPTDFLQDNPFVASAPAVASRPAENPLRRRVNKPDRARPTPPRPRELVTEEDLPAATTPGRTMVQATPVAAPAKPARQVTPRDFAAATVVAAAPTVAPSAPAPALDLAPEIPVDTRPLDRVDEELIASGIIAGPAGDTLTSQVPTSLAVAETPFSSASFLGETLAEPPVPLLSGAATPGFALATAPLSQPPSGPFSAGLTSAAPGAWEVEAGSPTPPPDIFKPQAAVGNLPAGFEQPTPGRLPPPTLPEGRPTRAQMMAAGRPGTNWAGMAIAAAALGGVGLFVWHQATQPGGLDNVNAQLAKLAQPRSTTLAQAPTDGAALLPPPTQLAVQAEVGKAQIEFAAPLPDPNQPIAATGTEAMPEDISMFAKLQQEIQTARAAREGGAGGAATVAGGATAAATAPLTKEQSDKELEQYRQLLASADPNTAPKPREFLRDPDAYMDGSSNTPPVSSADGALLPPPATRAEQGRASNGALPPPNELYTNNPNNLPIVAEPQMQEAPRIRQLEDFAAELFPQDAPKVKIPQGVRPQLAATDFPSLDVLSFVPGRGLIASANGKEGVLMVGESISGWQLTDVSTDMAEFRAGNRSYILTAQN